MWKNAVAFSECFFFCIYGNVLIIFCARTLSHSLSLSLALSRTRLTVPRTVGLTFLDALCLFCVVSCCPKAPKHTHTDARSNHSLHPPKQGVRYSPPPITKRGDIFWRGVLIANAVSIDQFALTFGVARNQFLPTLLKRPQCITLCSVWMCDVQKCFPVCQQ